MAREIERKYLILGDAWRALPVSGVKDITQAYLTPGTPVSIQFDNGKAAFSFGTKAGAVAFAVPVAGDFADIRAFPNYDAATGRLAPDPAMVFRIRTAGEDAAYVTIKRPTGDAAVNDEYELLIPVAEARRIQSLSCECFVAKTRHMIDFHNVMWEVDVFSGPLQGLVIAEVEAMDRDAFNALAMLPGVAEDVTEMKGVSNYALGRDGIPQALKNRLAPGFRP
jgi:CYTH domain-containing protein